MERNYCYEYPRPAVTADIVIFHIEGDDLEILLIQRKNKPFQYQWAFPGGFMEIDETIDTCAKRELEEETALKNIDLHEIGCFSRIDRDPRGRTISIAFYGIADKNKIKPTAQDDAQSIDWFNINKLPELAFDHQLIFEKAYSLLKEKQNFQK